MPDDRTVTVSSFDHGFSAGQTLNLVKDEDRWYMKLWYTITFRKCPRRTMSVVISNVEKDSFTYEI